MSGEVVSPDDTNMVLFKVRDYSTHIVGRFRMVKPVTLRSNVPLVKEFYVERGDGSCWSYDADRVEWFKPLTINN